MLELIDDLWLEVWKRLPVKTLLQLQLVCKHWKSIISSSTMIAKHLSFASLNPPSNKPYLEINAGEIDHNSYTLHNSDTHDVLRFPFRLVGNLAGRHPNDIYHMDVYRLYIFPRGSPTKSPLNFTCVDIIHGVVCISYSLDSGFDSTILWNPSIHKYISLPKASFHLDPLHMYTARFACHAIGFGYDESNKDFKVARLWIPCRETKRKLGPNVSPICEVNSCREGEWRRVAVVMDNDNDNNSVSLCSFRETWSLRTSCYVNGRIHWIMTIPYIQRSFVVMLECESEELSMTELPSEMLDYRLAKPTIPMVLNYASMLSVVVTFQFPTPAAVVELWVMNPYGATGSWQRMYRFQKKEIIYGSYMFQGVMPPYGPRQWCRLFRHNVWFHEVLSFHAFQETMCLMDQPNARSYTRYEKVEILVT